MRFAFIGLLCLLPALVRAQAVVPAGSGINFYGRGPYRKSVPRPSAILGYEAGERHSNFRDQERVILAIAQAAKDRVRIEEYGKSSEGRPLRLLIVSAPENQAKLETIRAQIGKLADPRQIHSEAESLALLQSTPAVTWINHCIHGDETASFESAMWAFYTLAASEAPEILDALRKTVVILNPVYNPDGHERFVVYYNSVAVGAADGWAYEQDEPWAIYGRLNHYRFDMNRDKLAQSQQETRAETSAFLRWHPQVYADEHGQPENYFFPPNALPANRNVDRARLSKWTDIFGRANGAAFDRHGWTYVTRETFDFFYPGYLDSWTTLSGAIGMTYETDGGGNLARRRSDGTISTLRDATAHHFETAMTTILTAAQHREELLRDYLAYHRQAILAGQTDRMHRVVLLPGSDPGRLAKLAALLTRMGVEVQEAKVAFPSGKVHPYLPPQPSGIPNPKQPPDPNAPPPGVPPTFPPGTLIVDFAQPQGHVARAFLEPDADFEPDFIREQYARRERNEKKNDNERKEEYGFYDITAWSLPYAYGLQAFWTEDAPSVETRLLTLDAQGTVTLQTASGGVQGGKAKVAYLFRYDRDTAAVLALRLLQEGYKLAVATKPVRAEGKDWPRGTLIARVIRNPESLHTRIASLAKSLGVDIFAVNSNYGEDSPVTLGSDSVVSLSDPKVAVIEDDMVSATSFGAVWHLFEQEASLAFTPMRIGSLRGPTLARFNVLIFPDGGGYAGALGKERINSLKEWVAGGGVLIGLGGGGLWFTDKDADLSSAAIVGRDAKPDEKAGNSEDKTPDTKTGPTKPDEKPKPKKPLPLPGAIFRAQIDPTHFLGYGYESGEIAMPLDGATFLKPSKKGANVVTFGKSPLVLSGFVWSNNTEELLTGTTCVVDETIGDGHAILYLSDPTFRSLWHGLRRLFYSAILFGPTRPPLESLKNAGE